MVKESEDELDDSVMKHITGLLKSLERNVSGTFSNQKKSGSEFSTLLHIENNMSLAVTLSHSFVSWLPE